ncbi:MAG TPA: HDOD domain-containing protein [Pirellulaceae bacterium]|nr:HDOD domain-containing protein [Pirellulaceae bacterium]
MTAIVGCEQAGPQPAWPAQPPTPAQQSVGLVRQFVERTGQLYSLPAVAVEVLRLTGEPRVDARSLKDCIERDPALTARILRVVNSSLFGVSRPVTDLSQALALLGTRPLKMLVLGFSLPKELFSGLEASVLGRYWRRSLVKAVAARDLAEKLWQTSGDEPFIAGLIQDIGSLALIQHLGPSYIQLLDHVQSHGGNLLDRELDTLGFDHVVLSSRLLAHWGLPASLCAAVSAPADEARIAQLEPGQRTLTQVLHLAELLARLIEQPFGPALRDLLNVGARYCGLTYDKLQALVSAVQTKVNELAEVLALELPAGSSYVDLLIAAQQRLSDESAMAAVELAGTGREDQLLSLAGQMRRDLQLAAERGPLHAPPLAPTLTETPTEPFVRSPLRGPPPEAVRRSQPFPVPAAVEDVGLSGLVTAAMGRCRQARCPLSLALFQIDGFGELLLHVGPGVTTELTHWLQSALSEWTAQPAVARHVSDSSLAVALEDCPRSEAVRLARHVLEAVKPWAAARFDSAKLTLSAGLATLEFPPKNFPPHELIDGALRCLSGAELSGGDTVKSIEL